MMKKRKNKNVIKIHSDTEFNDAMDKAKKENKGVVIDFFLQYGVALVFILALSLLIYQKNIQMLSF